MLKYKEIDGRIVVLKERRNDSLSLFLSLQCLILENVPGVLKNSYGFLLTFCLSRQRRRDSLINLMMVLAFANISFQFINS